MAASKLSLFLAAAATVSAQACSTNIPFPYRQPIIAPGYTAKIIAANLTEPRGIAFDSAGNLLIAQNAAGVVALTLKDEGGSCVSVASKQVLSENKDITHSIEMSEDGKTVYITDVENLYAIPYDVNTMTLSSTNTTLVTGMTGTDHVSRTTLFSKKVPGTVLINRGSFDNVDLEAADINSGHSNIRAFDITKGNLPIKFNDGKRVSWGTRNSVGIAEHPISGGIYSVENSVDNIERNGTNIHENNPGEEMNFHGYLNGTAHPNFGANFGYPYCFAAWNTTEIPNNEGLTVGSNFAMDSANKTYNDEFCKTQTVSPRLTFPAHWAPLDIKFNPTGTTAWVTAHGSWNRDEADGYLLFTLAFDPKTGEPIAPPTATDHIIRILQNGFVNDCPDNCFRPVSLAWDKKGRLFMSSDLTNEIFLITKSDGSGVADIDSPASTSAVAAAAAPAAAKSSRSVAGADAANAKRAILGAAAAGAYGFNL